MVYVSNRAALNQQLRKPQDIDMCGQQIPIEPARLVVLAVGVIVSALATPHLVAHEKHGNAAGQHKGCEKVLDLPVAELLNYGIVSGPFKTAVPASVVLAAVA